MVKKELIEEISNKLYKRFTTPQVVEAGNVLKIKLSGNKRKMLEQLIEKEGSGDYKKVSMLFSKKVIRKEKEKKPVIRETENEILEQLNKKKKTIYIPRHEDGATYALIVEKVIRDNNLKGIRIDMYLYDEEPRRLVMKYASTRTLKERELRKKIEKELERKFDKIKKPRRDPFDGLDYKESVYYEKEGSYYMGKKYPKGEFYLKINYPRWYRHPKEYGREEDVMDSKKWDDVSNFEDEVETLFENMKKKYKGYNFTSRGWI